MLAIGDRVKIVGGAFEDFEGTIEDLKQTDQKARVLISIYGRGEIIQVDFSELKRVLLN